MSVINVPLRSIYYIYLCFVYLNFFHRHLMSLHITFRDHEMAFFSILSKNGVFTFLQHSNPVSVSHKQKGRIKYTKVQNQHANSKKMSLFTLLHTLIIRSSSQVPQTLLIQRKEKNQHLQTH